MKLDALILLLSLTVSFRPCFVPYLWKFFFRKSFYEIAQQLNHISNDISNQMTIQSLQLPVGRGQKSAAVWVERGGVWRRPAGGLITLSTLLLSLSVWWSGTHTHGHRFLQLTADFTSALLVHYDIQVSYGQISHTMHPSKCLQKCMWYVNKVKLKLVKHLC